MSRRPAGRSHRAAGQPVPTTGRRPGRPRPPGLDNRALPTLLAHLMHQKHLSDQSNQSQQSNQSHQAHPSYLAHPSHPSFRGDR
ncbi:MAG TPA: hypothetical protein VG435_04070 [Acidimicrobiales bacterium]|jgi:hypothetical protein|nr:hypothetical protein [Acidimicrobiales bacterium]